MDIDGQLVGWLQVTAATAALGMLKRCVKYFADISDSIESLNKNVAVILERTMAHEKRLDEHSERLVNLESTDAGLLQQ